MSIDILCIACYNKTIEERFSFKYIIPFLVRNVKEVRSNVWQIIYSNVGEEKNLSPV